MGSGSVHVTPDLFHFLELRHKVELHRMTGRGVECPLDKMNLPRGAKDAALRIPPTEPEAETLFASWGGELAIRRKFALTAQYCTAAKLMSQVGLRVSEACNSTWPTSTGTWDASAGSTPGMAKAPAAQARWYVSRPADAGGGAGDVPAGAASADSVSAEKGLVERRSYSTIASP
jgi:hypothetical protein